MLHCRLSSTPQDNVRVGRKCNPAILYRLIFSVVLKDEAGICRTELGQMSQGAAKAPSSDAKKRHK